MILTTTSVIAVATIGVSLLCFNNRGVFYRLSLNPYSIAKKHQWDRVITHGFVHADYMHLLINMLVMWSFGRYMESFFSVFRPDLTAVLFSALYFGGMIAACIPDIIKYRDNPYYNSIGASGAVSALVFASIFINPWGKLLIMGVIPMPSIIFGACYLWYESYMGRRGGDNINHGAHIWGAIYGFIFPIAMDMRMLDIFVEQLLHPNFF